MSKLLKLVKTLDNTLAKDLSALITLSKYAVAYRYPDMELKLEELSDENVKAAIKLAENTFLELSKRIN